MNGKDQRKVTGQFLEHPQQVHQDHRVIDVRGAVEGEDPVGSVRVERQALEDGRVFPFRSEHLKRVNHDIPDEVDLSRLDSFSQQVLPPAFLCHEEEVGDRIRENSINLLRHGSIETPQSSLHVRHRNPELHGCQGGRQSGVHIAHDKDEVRTLRHQDGLQSPHHLRGLNRVSSGSHTEVEIWR